MSNLELVTTAQVADLLGRDTATINRWANQGRLQPAMQAPGVRGSRWFLRRDIEQLASQLREGESATPA